MTKSGIYNDPQLGAVHIRTLSTARRFIARWKDGEVYITIPPYTTNDQYRKAMRELTPKLLARKPAPVNIYFDGFHFANDLLEVTIRVDHTMKSGHISWQRVNSDDTYYKYEIMVASDWIFGDKEYDKIIKHHLCDIAAMVAANEITLEALICANNLGLNDNVKSYKIGRGDQRLGSCSSKKIITLSRIIVFLPSQLRRHIITHELAHLTHMNHSAAFHALWAKYDGANHTANRIALRKFRFPFPK